jgi:regulator of protease activity HflC (stomatin/prohibitin superfamily)
MDAFAWIGQIFEWFGKFIPRWVIINRTEGGVKYVRGREVKVLAPGIHWYWPAITEIDTYPTARQADRLQTQTMSTTDDITIIVGGLLVYKVEDVGKLLPTTFEPSIAIKDIALTAVHDVCCEMDWATLKLEQRKGTLNTKLKNAAQKELADYGVKVIKLMLTDLAKCRVLKLSQSMSQEEN